MRSAHYSPQRWAWITRGREPVRCPLRHMPRRQGRGDPERASVRDSVRQPDALAVRLQAGDASALEELFERDGGQAFRLAYRVLQDGAAAEDAVQEAFAQLWERAPGLSAAGNIRSLLMTIV